MGQRSHGPAQVAAGHLIVKAGLGGRHAVIDVYKRQTQGGKAGVAYVKHIERKRERKCRLYMTYGFLIKENPHRYVYCAELRCRESDPLAVRLDTLRAVSYTHLDVYKRQIPM